MEAAAAKQDIDSNEMIQSSDTHERIREKRSIEYEDNVQLNSDSQDVLVTESPIDQEQLKISNDQTLELDRKPEIIPKVEDVPKTTPNTKDDEVSGSTEKLKMNKEEPLDETVELHNHEITLSKVLETGKY